jgi:ABC-type glycerol-3-phosphate transport system substrate-binding protein
MKRLLLILAMFATALLLASCGGGGPEAVTLAFDAEDTFEFSPDSASAQAGAEVEVTLNSVGALDHTWALVEEGLDRNSIRR